MIVNGLTPANHFSGSGIVVGGTNAEETKVSGKIAMKPDRVGRLRAGGDQQSDEREHPRERIADQQQQPEAGDHLHETPV